MLFMLYAQKTRSVGIGLSPSFAWMKLQNIHQARRSKTHNSGLMTGIDLLMGDGVIDGRFFFDLVGGICFSMATGPKTPSELMSFEVPLLLKIGGYITQDFGLYGILIPVNSRFSMGTSVLGQYGLGLGLGVGIGAKWKITELVHLTGEIHFKHEYMTHISTFENPYLPLRPLSFTHNLSTVKGFLGFVFNFKE